MAAKVARSVALPWRTGLSWLRASVEIHYRNDFAAQIDDPAHMGGHLRHNGDGGEPDDFADLEDVYAVGLATERERKIFSGEPLGGGGRAFQ